MPDSNRFEEQLAQTLQARVEGLRGAHGVADTAREASRRRRRRTGLVIALATVAVVAGIAVNLGRSGQPDRGTADVAGAPKPFSSMCVDVARRAVPAATTLDLTRIVDAEGVAGALCQFDGARGMLIRGWWMGLTQGVDLTKNETAAVAALLVDAKRVRKPCSAAGNVAASVSLVVVLDTAAGLLTLDVPTRECLGVSLASRPSDSLRWPVESGAALEFLRSLLAT